MKFTLIGALMVGAGGFIGAICRYAVVAAIGRNVATGAFPLGTFVVNMLGCFVIGLFTALVETRTVFSEEVRLFVLLGLLGSFTTYSTFGHESLIMIKNGQTLHAVGNIGLHIVVGLLCVAAGYMLVTSLSR